MSDGTFVVNDVQAKAVKFIFQQIRAGKTLPHIISALKKRFADGGVIEGKDQYWDRVKVKRILNHSPLYCQGRYEGGRGQAINLPALAFLPAEWVNTHQITTKPHLRLHAQST